MFVWNDFLGPLIFLTDRDDYTLALGLHLYFSQQGSTPWLCTIAQATGSSPRPVGSMLVCTGSSQQVGSVSGGCVEEDLLAKLAANKFDDVHPTILEYGVSAAENERLGLPCGG